MTAVLVVDDDPHLLKVLKINLKANGYTAVTATGRIALGSHPHPLASSSWTWGCPTWTASR